ncbi:hypothetical protein HDV05_008548, partial [Chytridiales sp. JEL 0842]
MVNWRTLTLTFRDATYTVLPPPPSPPASPERPTLCSEIDVELLNDSEFFRLAHRESLDVFVAHMEVRPITGTNQQVISLSSVLTTKEYAATKIPTDSRCVPLKYNNFKDVFNLKSDPPPTLAPHRPYDLAIEFVRDAEGKPPTLPPPAKVYPLSPAEEQVLQEFLTKALARQWISP